jgi:hypothetical protein
MVFNNSHGIKVVDEATYNTMKSAVDPCTTLIAKCNQGDSFFDDFACQSAFLVCNMGLTSPYQMTGLNPYDIRYVRYCVMISTWSNSPFSLFASVCMRVIG